MDIIRLSYLVLQVFLAMIELIIFFSTTGRSPQNCDSCTCWAGPSGLACVGNLRA